RIRVTGTRGVRLLRRQLRGIVEESLFRHALAFPALTGELLDPRPRSVEPFELEDPTDHDVIAVHEDRRHALRADRCRTREDLALAGDERRAPDARCRLVLLHRRVLRVELLDRLDVLVALDPRNEAFERFSARHDLSPARTSRRRRRAARREGR